MRRQSLLLRLASVFVLPLAVINDGLAEGDSSPGMAGTAQTEAALIQSTYVPFDEREAAGGSFGAGERGLGNFENSQASEPTRNRVEYQVTNVPRISF